ncbi:MAG: hypothetical protein WKF71_16175 [Pyrinomonadaceae bacterium]
MESAGLCRRSQHRRQQRSTGSLSRRHDSLFHVSNRTGGFGLGDIYSSVRVSVNRSSPADFDGDGRTDTSAFSVRQTELGM